MNPNGAPQLVTVLGPLALDEVGMTDAHQHVWIERVPGVAQGAPVLDDRDLVRDGLAQYRAAGGEALLDCQPGGCGRNAGALAALSHASGISIVACTGFHLRKYYPPDHWLFSASESKAGDLFIRELESGVSESPAEGAIRAGFIKIACTADLEQTSAQLLGAAAEACRQTGAAVLVHTEQGSAADEILRRLDDLGARPERVVLCHIDKRPEISLHKALADSGALLEYDTFFRSKYDPERNVWPLVERMLADGYSQSLAFGTDLADSESWRDPGPAGLPRALAPRLSAMGCSNEVVAALTGRNIVARLAT